jgi:hypothetical protein
MGKGEIVTRSKVKCQNITSRIDHIGADESQSHGQHGGWCVIAHKDDIFAISGLSERGQVRFTTPIVSRPEYSYTD